MVAVKDNHLIKNTKKDKMENTFENALKYVQHLDRITESWYNDSKTIASAMMSYAAKTSEKSKDIGDVMPRMINEEECKMICRRFVIAATPSEFIRGIDDRFEQAWNATPLDQKLK